MSKGLVQGINGYWVVFLLSLIIKIFYTYFLFLWLSQYKEMFVCYKKPKVHIAANLVCPNPFDDGGKGKEEDQEEEK